MTDSPAATEFSREKKLSRITTCLALFGIAVIFCAATYLRFAGKLDWPGYDASEYHYVAKNIASGRGLKVNVVAQFYPRPPSVEHQIIPFHQPLNYYILAVSYRIFGVNFVGARAAGVLMDFILALAIFFVAKRLSGGDVWVSFFSAAIFSVHSTSLSARFSGGAAAGFAMLFGFCFAWFAYKATTNPVHFITAGIFGALSYLTRNEGLFTIVALTILWLFLKDRRKKLPYFLAGLGVILIAFLLWEARNYFIYGAQATSSRYNMMFGRDYYDMWRYNPEPSVSNFISEYIKIGLPKIIITKIQSWHYKLLWAMDSIGFPVALFLIAGLSAPQWNKKILIAPAIYFISTYGFFGFFNAHSQQWGWYAAEVFLPLWIIVGCLGCFNMPFEFLKDKIKLRRLAGIFCASALLIFYITDNVKVYFKNKKIISDAVAELAFNVNRFRTNNEKFSSDIVMMTHIPYIFNYFYPDMKMVQIPTNEPLETVKEVIIKYKCDYLVLYGIIPSAYPFVFKDMYYGKQRLDGFKEVYSCPNPSGLSLEGAGPYLKIFKISRDKILH